MDYGLHNVNYDYKVIPQTQRQAQTIFSAHKVLKSKNMLSNNSHFNYQKRKKKKIHI